MFMILSDGRPEMVERSSRQLPAKRDEWLLVAAPGPWVPSDSWESTVTGQGLV
jgi:hypothetical protein